MKAAPYRHTRWLQAAGALSVLGQLSAIAFMLRPNPFTTFAFMTGGVACLGFAVLLFAYVIYRDIRARTDSVKERRFKAGELIFEQGDVGDRVYVVTEGEVEIFRTGPNEAEVAIARLGKGQYFGEMALLSDAPRNASVRAVDDVTALAIERTDFQTLFASVPAFKESVDRAVAARAK